MRVKIAAITERVRNSFFFVPMLFVVAGVALGEAGITLDRALEDPLADLPIRLTSTVDSGRLVLSVVAGATITFASIAFSVSLLIISLTSSQYSPRVVQGLFRDRTNKRVIGVVVGTFAYCLIVIRSVGDPLGDGGRALVPSISVGMAVLFGLAAILSIVAFIDHSAHSMDISKILHRITQESLGLAERLWSAPDDGAVEVEDDVQGDHAVPDGSGFTVTLGANGWIQQIDVDGILSASPPEATVRLDTTVGRYAVDTAPLCTMWPPPADTGTAIRLARESINIAPARSMQQDVAYGIRQLADIALKALSPGVNDPTTAQDAIFHLGSVIAELLRRTPPPARRTGPEDRVVLDPHRVTHEEVVGLAFNQVRVAARNQPEVQIYLLEVIHTIVSSLTGPGLERRAALLRRQADLVVADGRSSGLLAHDRSRVVDAYLARFGSGGETS